MKVLILLLLTWTSSVFSQSESAEDVDLQIFKIKGYRSNGQVEDTDLVSNDSALFIIAGNELKKYSNVRFKSLHRNSIKTYKAESPTARELAELPKQILHVLTVSDLKFTIINPDSAISEMTLSANYTLIQMPNANILKDARFKRSAKYLKGNTERTAIELIQLFILSSIEKYIPSKNVFSTGEFYNPDAIEFSFLVFAGPGLNYHYKSGESHATEFNSSIGYLGDYFKGLASFHFGFEVKAGEKWGFGYSYQKENLNSKGTFVSAMIYQDYYKALNEKMALETHELFIIYRYPLPFASKINWALRPQLVFTTYSLEGTLIGFPYKMTPKSGFSPGFLTGIDTQLENSKIGFYLLAGGTYRKTEESSIEVEGTSLGKYYYREIRDFSLDLRAGVSVSFFSW